VDLLAEVTCQQRVRSNLGSGASKSVLGVGLIQLGRQKLLSLAQRAEMRFTTLPLAGCSTPFINLLLSEQQILFSPAQKQLSI
jgi:hypothetical protein